MTLTMGTHTIKAFDEDLRLLRARIAEMGGLAETQLHDAIDTLIRRDVEAARTVVAADAKLDFLEEEVERMGVRIIALRTPMADDLRDVIAALKISAVLERIGDYAKNMAKRTLVVADAVSLPPMKRVPPMVESARLMLHDAIDAYIDRDARLAADVCRRDRDVDDAFDDLFHDLLTYMVDHSQHMTACAHLLFIAKNVERIGDHATNIAEMAHFCVTGDHMIERPKGRSTVSLDIDDIDDGNPTEGKG